MLIPSSLSSPAIMTRLLLVIVLIAVIAATTAERSRIAEKNILKAIIQAHPDLQALLHAVAMEEIGKEAQEQDISYMPLESVSPDAQWSYYKENQAIEENEIVNQQDWRILWK